MKPAFVACTWTNGCVRHDGHRRACKIRVAGRVVELPGRVRPPVAR